MFLPKFANINVIESLIGRRWELNICKNTQWTQIPKNTIFERSNKLLSCVSSPQFFFLTLLDVYMRMRFKGELISWMGDSHSRSYHRSWARNKFPQADFRHFLRRHENVISLKTRGIIYDARQWEVCRLKLYESYWRHIQLIFPSTLFMVWQVWKANKISIWVEGLWWEKAYRQQKIFQEWIFWRSFSCGS